MFEFFKHFTAKTKILLIGFILILIPVAVISYMSMQSVNQKAENLKTNYTGTVRLVRDKLESEILSLEENLQNSVAGSDINTNITELKTWLADLEQKNPAFKNMFLMNSEGGLITSTLSCCWQVDQNLNAADYLLLNTNIKRAEEAEFRKKNLPEAISYYKRGFAKSSEAQKRALVRSRIARCYFKSQNYEQGIKEYQQLLDLNSAATIGNVPSEAVAMSQISLGYSELDKKEELIQINYQLYRYLIEHPWDIYGGDYLFYLKQTKSELQNQMDSGQISGLLKTELKELKIQENRIIQQIEFLQLLRQNQVSEMESGLNRNNSSENRSHKILTDQKGNTAQIRFFKLPASLQADNLQIMGYRFNENHLLSEQIPEILSTVELGKDLLTGIVAKNDTLLFIQNGQSVPDYLVSEDFETLFDNWKVALFHQDGQTLEELVGKEKNLYRMLFAGIILIMLVGLIVIVRAVIHESEMARIKSEFISNVSHELKTPLALIRMFGETLDSGIVSDEKKRKEFYGIIRTESERLTHLINNVLDFSKMDTGRKKYNFVEADLVHVVKSSLEAYKFHIRDNGFKIESKFPDEPIILNIDKDSISQAVLNLLSNAVKYSDKKKYIKVQVQKGETSALITVTDKGIGIPKNELKKIFEKFYRVTDEKVHESRGTGLGLTLTKQIIEAHSGEIEVKSEAGKGSQFTIRIPLN